MTTPVLTFFNCRASVGKTSLVYHLAWMLSEIGERVLLCDLDPQADLTSACIDDEPLEALWQPPGADRTMHQCVQPVCDADNPRRPKLQMLSETLGLIPGDPALVHLDRFHFGHVVREIEPYDFVLNGKMFWQVMHAGATAMDASIILVDTEPSLGPLNRSALIASDYLLVPLGADLPSLSTLAALASTRNGWYRAWQQHRKEHGAMSLPEGLMSPIGYVVQQPSLRLTRPVLLLDHWVNQLPQAYAHHVRTDEDCTATPAEDPHCLAVMPRYASLHELAAEARKPMFALKPVDGALGGHAGAVVDARRDYRALAEKVRQRIGLAGC